MGYLKNLEEKNHKAYKALFNFVLSRVVEKMKSEAGRKVFEGGLEEAVEEVLCLIDKGVIKIKKKGKKFKLVMAKE